jgi:hypothetical protein
VFGYSCFNDMSVRDYQKKTASGPSARTSTAPAAFGPLLVTADELPPGATGLRIQSRLNGQVMQDANTDDMIWAWRDDRLLTECMTLEPGDVIAMGTPAGVGQARTPPVWMKDGDRSRSTSRRSACCARRSATRADAQVLYDVAIVGYGRRRAVAAALLAGWAWRLHVCDRSHAIYDKPRAFALDHEIMRVFQQLGVPSRCGVCGAFHASEFYGVDGQLIKRIHHGGAALSAGLPAVARLQPAGPRAHLAGACGHAGCGRCGAWAHCDRVCRRMSMAPRHLQGGDGAARNVTGRVT